MSKKLEKIVREAEYTVIPEEEPSPVVEAVPGALNLEDVAEMVMVGRMKNGAEFVQLLGTDDALKAKAYADYGRKYFDMIIDRALYERARGNA